MSDVERSQSSDAAVEESMDSFDKEASSLGVGFPAVESSAIIKLNMGELL